MMVKLAFDNLTYNKKRTIALVFLIAISFSGILLLSGYMSYMKNGMQLGYTASTGDIRIAPKGYFEKESKRSVLNPSDIKRIDAVVSEIEEIEEVNSPLSINGLLGRDGTSTYFMGIATNEPNSRYGVGSKGLPITKENEVLIGEKLAEELGILEQIENYEKPYVDLMFTFEGSGVGFLECNVSGIYETDTDEYVSMILICSKESILNALDAGDHSSYYELYLDDMKNLDKVKDKLIASLGDDYDIQDWKEMNPSYDKVALMFDTIYYFLCFVMYILIFVSISLSLIAEYTARLKEFGTLKAIGMKNSNLVIMILAEVFMLCLFGIIIGMGFSYIVKQLAILLEWTYIPPGYTTGFLVDFIFTKKEIALISVFTILIGAVSSFFPIKKVKDCSASVLMGE